MADFYEESDDRNLPLRETVYIKLRKQILTGELKPGERLMEIHLANKLDVSRTPIREAIRKLELEGLVKITPGSGAQVAPISKKELNDVLEVRRALDALSCELACARIDAQGKAKLKKSREKFEIAVRNGDPGEITSADVTFHDIINRAAGNTCLLEVSGRLADQVYRYRYVYIREDENYEQLISEHRNLANAIIEGDSKAAVRAARAHIDRQEKSIIAQLGIDDNENAK
ncbi:MAG: GntR family transcriptional regulator [Clostridiales bacterium]|nr:GntR family transcriptional regulator [Clostridiales bacterium]